VANVAILKPRLDVTFKKGAVPDKKGPIQPIRQHWADFVKVKTKEHKKLGDKVQIIEKPLWQFTPEFVNNMNSDIVYVPHHGRKTFLCDTQSKQVLYYMQMVFPWMFQVDPEGWCADASVWPIQPAEKTNGRIFEALRRNALSGNSKFVQPAIQKLNLPENFVFFPCQIPHDQTIKLHSDISVPEALEKTIEIATDLKIPLIVKPHPVNKVAMQPLLEIVKKHHEKGVYWVDGINIHQLLGACDAVFTVNSGAGMEALLHRKPVYTFGRADYACVSHDVSTGNFDWEAREKFIEKIPAFFEAYVSNMTILK